MRGGKGPVSAAKALIRETAAVRRSDPVQRAQVRAVSNAPLSVPLFIDSPEHIRPVKIDKLASRIDIAPTVLALLNIRYRSHLFGKDILKRDPSRERAFLSTYARLGYLRNEPLGILDPKREIESSRIRWVTGEYPSLNAFEPAPWETPPPGE